MARAHAGIGINSFYGPWLRGSTLVRRSFAIREGKELQSGAAFNLFNHANYYVQNGDGINQLQYNPSGPTAATACPPTSNAISYQFGQAISDYGEISQRSSPRSQFPQDSRSSAFH